MGAQHVHSARLVQATPTWPSIRDLRPDSGMALSKTLTSHDSRFSRASRCVNCCGVTMLGNMGGVTMLGHSGGVTVVG